MVDVLVVGGCYLIGGIPVGVLLARSRGVDLRKVGSGNIGATNLFRALGLKYGLLGFALDTLKGLVPVALCRSALSVSDRTLAVAGFAAVFGHCFSPYLRFRGGRGVATSLGIALALYWPAGALPFLAWLAVTASTRYVSLGSVIALVLAPLVGAALGASDPFVVALAAASILSIMRHVENIDRLVRGTENRLGSARSSQAVPSGEEIKQS